MPNWCLNKLTISHAIIDQVDRFEDAYSRGTTCADLLPEPKDQNGEPITGEKYDENGKFKMPDWYNWRIANWGCKWDFGYDEQYGLKGTRVGNEFSCSFDTAWSPPIGLYERLHTLNYEVKAYYFEPGMVFCGTWVNGNDLHWDGDVDSWPDMIKEMWDMDAYFQDGSDLMIDM